MNPLPQSQHIPADDSESADDLGSRTGFQDTDTGELRSAQALGRSAVLDPHLIDSFKAARLRLKRMCDFIEKHARAEAWDTVEEAIDRFRSRLTDHLLVETFKLYSNTRQQLKESPLEYEAIKTCGVEMSNLCHDIVQFIESNRHISQSVSLQEAFLPHWTTLTQQLQQRWRIEEEQLYPVYRQLLSRGSTLPSRRRERPE